MQTRLQEKYKGGPVLSEWLSDYSDSEDEEEKNAETRVEEEGIPVEVMASTQDDNVEEVTETENADAIEEEPAQVTDEQDESLGADPASEADE